jgi:uncharacterized protein (DUF2141 family)
MPKSRLSGLSLALTALSALPAPSAAAAPMKGSERPPPKLDLHVHAVGFKHQRGHAIAKLFVAGQRVTGSAHSTLRAEIRGTEATFNFAMLAEGPYALVVFHDENDNGTVDHGFFGHGVYGPIEPIGFSNGYRLTLFSLPTFDKLKFILAPNRTHIEVGVK